MILYLYSCLGCTLKIEWKTNHTIQNKSITYVCAYLSTLYLLQSSLKNLLRIFRAIHRFCKIRHYNQLPVSAILFASGIFQPSPSHASKTQTESRTNHYQKQPSSDTILCLNLGNIRLGHWTTFKYANATRPTSISISTGQWDVDSSYHNISIHVSLFQRTTTFYL